MRFVGGGFSYYEVRELKPKVILVDFSWVYHKSFYTFPNFIYSNSSDMVTYHTGGIYGVVKDIRSLYDKYKCPIFVCVEPAINFRKELYPGYKVGRERPDSLYQMWPLALRAAASFSFTTLLTSEEAGEADDVIYTLVGEVPCEEGEYVGIYANDDDLYQCAALVKPDQLYRIGGKDSFIQMKVACERKYKVSPDKILLFRSIIGDASDKIPPVASRFSRKYARELVLGIREPSDFKGGEEGTKEAEILLEKRVDWQRNYDLMRLRKLSLEQLFYEPISLKEYDTKYALPSFGRFFEGVLRG